MRASVQSDLAQFKEPLTAALAAAKANDLKQAKQESANAVDAWQAVEDKVKAKSKDSYKILETGLSDVQTRLVIPPNPDKDKSIKALEAMLKTVDTEAAKLK